jgi:hypothetical protein
MGDRSRIIIISKEFAAPIHLYGHHSGLDNLQAVKNVIEVTDRIGDPDYLTSQLFHEFARLGDYGGTLGFGIGCYEESDSMDDRDPVIVNADSGSYSFGGVEFGHQG